MWHLQLACNQWAGSHHLGRDLPCHRAQPPMSIPIPLSLCASQRSGFVFYSPQRPCWHWVRTWWWERSLGLSCCCWGHWVWGLPWWAARQLCPPVWQCPGTQQQGEVKAALQTGTISNKWGLSVNTYDLCAFSKPHMNIFLVLKTSLWSMWCSLSPFCGVGKMTGFKWDFKYLTAACSAKSFVTFEGAAIQIR